jgi:type I restriction enzyme R subunit
MDFEKFRAKARQFLLDHEDHPAIHKLRWNEPLTADDIACLEKILIEAGAATDHEIDRAKEEPLGCAQ